MTKNGGAESQLTRSISQVMRKRRAFINETLYIPFVSVDCWCYCWYLVRKRESGREAEKGTEKGDGEKERE